jgi:hypothetical protein
MLLVIMLKLKRAKRVNDPSEAREPPAGTRFISGRRPDNKASTYNYHNLTNNPKQLKTTFVVVVLLSVKNHHHTDYGSSKQPRKLIFGVQPYLNPTI